MPKVYQVSTVLHGLILIVYSDGVTRLYDMRQQIRDDAELSPLKDENTFRRTLTVLDGSVAWDLTGDRDPHRCILLDAQALYPGRQEN